MKINLKYLALTLLLFATEVCIALFVHDDFIRPYFGDFLVVILIYCFVKSFFDWPVLKAAVGVLLFSFLIETLQYFNFVAILHLESNKIARTVIGNSFSWADMVTYCLGISCVAFVEYAFRKEKTNAS